MYSELKIKAIICSNFHIFNYVIRTYYLIMKINSFYHPFMKIFIFRSKLFYIWLVGFVEMWCWGRWQQLITISHSKLQVSSHSKDIIPKLLSRNKTFTFFFFWYKLLFPLKLYPIILFWRNFQPQTTHVLQSYIPNLYSESELTIFPK